MSPDLIACAALILAYLMGSVSAAILVCRAMRLPDPRTDGSRNPGTTNVLRIGGKPAAALTLTGDMLKGVIPVLLEGTPMPAASDLPPDLCALAERNAVDRVVGFAPGVRR